MVYCGGVACYDEYGDGSAEAIVEYDEGSATVDAVVTWAEVGSSWRGGGSSG